MATSKSAWLGLGTVACGLWIAVLFACITPLVCRREDADALHPIVIACGMSVVFGSPVLSVFCLIAVLRTRQRGEILPRLALWSRNLSFAVTGGLVLIYIAVIGTRFLNGD